MALEIKNLNKDFKIRKSWGRSTVLHAVQDVSFTLERGKTIALVGESGSGKSTVARIVVGLETATSGDVILEGQVKGNRDRVSRSYLDAVQMVFQDPFSSLNPFHSIEHHLARPLRIHKPRASRAEIHQEALALLNRVGLRPAEVFAAKRPHELSGGQRQRVAIARALAPGADYLIADEPVSMLDVSIRLNILNLLARLQRDENLGVLYITHDLATARHFSDEIMVMRKGQVVERGPSDEVILNPQNEYTKKLLAAAPSPDNQGKLRAKVRAMMAEKETQQLVATLKAENI